jgi:NAD(P)-dependent dehydrogenase (short-subunit alcohol dehydrogenase family)
VVVLGATGTIGDAITRSLLGRGATVVATGRNLEALNALDKSGAHVLPLAVEGSSPWGKRLLQECGAALGGAVDALVLCTGAHGPIGATRAIDIEDLRAYVDVHLVGIAAAVVALAPLLDQGGQPAVVAMSGGGATGPRPNYSPYAMAKVALVRLVENLALEEPTWRVNAVAPGFIASAIHDTSIAAGKGRSGEDPDDLRARMARSDDIARVTGLVDLLVAPAGPRATGRLISAQWDPWDDPAWMDRLARDPALGRIRRIDDHEFGTVTRGEPA